MTANPVVPGILKFVFPDVKILILSSDRFSYFVVLSVVTDGYWHIGGMCCPVFKIEDLFTEDHDPYSLCHVNLNWYVYIKVVARFMVVTAFLLNIQVLWDIVPCCLIKSWHPDGLMCFWNIRELLACKTVTVSRIL